MQLNQIREQIDQIDRALMVLLQERMGLALRTKKLKAEISDPAREAEMMKRFERFELDLVDHSFKIELMKTVIAESKRLQAKDQPLVGFQGEYGAYGEVAARQLVPGGAYIPCVAFADVFEGVRQGRLDIGVVPVENSLAGAVMPVNDLLTTTDLKVVGEVAVPIHHCLLATADTRLDDVREVYSHPQALSQCHRFLKAHDMTPQPYYDTAGAAKMLLRENPRASAVIAGELCAELYGLQILKQGLEDGPTNFTRFLQLSPAPYNGIGDKSSVIFVTSHEAGSLYRVLQLFAEAGINLTRIASMPVRSDPGRYAFFLDYEGPGDDPHIKAVAEKMMQLTVSVKHLGNYPAFRKKDDKD